MNSLLLAAGAIMIFLGLTDKQVSSQHTEKLVEQEPDQDKPVETDVVEANSDSGSGESDSDTVVTGDTPKDDE